MNSKNPIALITGGSRGLGKSMALHLADKGTDLVITYRQEKSEADAVVKQIQAKGRKAVALQLAVGDLKTYPGFVDALTGALKQTFGRERFDYLVNNAGAALYATIAETTEAQFDAVMNTHLKGTYFLTQKLIPVIEDGGRILNVSSGLARFSYPGSSAYAMMKGGIEVFTRYLAKELGPRRISANTIAPGAIATDFGGGHVRDNPEVNKGIAAQTALGRVGEADDVGAAVASLLASENGWINGQRIEVSGGIFL